MLTRPFSPIVSIYRDSYTVESLERMNRVTGNEFPVSGTAYLRDQATRLIRLAEDVYKAALPTQDRPC